MMARWMKLLLSLLGVLLAGPVQAQIATAQVESGLVRGNPGTFLGIPFAAPPVGDLRWKAPAAVKLWRGTLDARSFAPRCPQDVAPGGFGPWTHEYVIEPPVAEDCLFLNVWTPARSARDRLPVMVWIHGGAFTGGSGSVPIYDGTALSAQGIIIVTINYRLGVLGFLAHPELSREGGGASGNYGLMDQIAALQWIKRNIAAFGGDPARVTIAGQSAGAASVHDLLVSPMARGLFSGAIAQSGTGMGLNLPPLRDAEATGARSFAGKGLAELRAMSPEELAAALPKGEGERGLRFAPVRDGKVIPLTSATPADVPLLTGLTFDEGSAMNPAWFSTRDADGFRQLAERMFPTDTARFMSLYSADQPHEAVRTLLSDRGIAGMLHWVEQRPAASKAPVFGYLFTHVEPGKDAERYGAFHSSEIPYVFGTLDKSPERGFTAADRALSDRLMRYWANFVRSGNPNGEGLPRWPQLATGEIMQLDEEITPRPALSPEKQATYRDFIARGGSVGLF